MNMQRMEVHVAIPLEALARFIDLMKTDGAEFLSEMKPIAPPEQKPTRKQRRGRSGPRNKITSEDLIIQVLEREQRPLRPDEFVKDFVEYKPIAFAPNTVTSACSTLNSKNRIVKVNGHYLLPSWIGDKRYTIPEEKRHGPNGVPQHG